MATEIKQAESLQLQIAEGRVAAAKKKDKKYDELFNPRPPSKAILMKMYADLSKAHDSIYAAYNAILDDDNILRTKGKNTRDYYDSMIDSDSVLAGLIETRIGAVAGLEWEIHPASEDDNDIAIAEFVKYALEKIGNFESVLKALLGACVTGYSIAEAVWHDEVYEGALKLVPRIILSRRPERFRFDTDHNLRLLTTGDRLEGIIVPGYKFIVHSFQTRYSNPYGTSLMRAVWWSWWFKHHAFKWWLQAAERGAVLTPVGYYPNTFTPEERTEFAAALETFIGNKYVAAMQGSEVTFPQIKIDPNFCRGLVDTCDEQLRSRILGSTLSSGTADSGTRALGAVHDKRFQERIESDAKELMATLNNQLIRWIVFLNFSEPEQYPKFKMKYEPAKDMKQIGETIKLAASIGIPVSVRDAAELLGLPLAEEGEELIVAQQPMLPANPSNEESDDEGDDDDADETEVPEEEEAIKLTVKRRPKGKIKKAARSSVNARTKKYRANAEKLVKAAELYGEKPYLYFGVQIDKWLAQYSTLDQAYMNVNTFDLNDRLFAEYLTEARFLSAVMAYHDVYDNPQATEHLAKGSKPKLRQYTWQDTRDGILNIVSKVAGPRPIPYEDWKPIPSEDTIKRFQQKDVMTREDFDALLDHERRGAFTAARMSANTIERKLRPAMLRSLQEGKSLRDFKKEVEGIVISQAHAENIYRTNIQTAYNNGHAEAIFSSEMAPIIPAFQFDAIIDNRTTNICESRNGQVYARQDMEYLDVIPPCHFQCRSTITEIFVDEWDGKISPQPDVEAMQGFGHWQSQLAPRLPGPSPLPRSITFKDVEFKKREIPASRRAWLARRKKTSDNLIEQTKKPGLTTAKPSMRTALAPHSSGEYIKPYKKAPDKLSGTSIRAQRALPQYTKAVGDAMNKAYKIQGDDFVEAGAAVFPSGRLASQVVKGEEYLISIPTNRLALKGQAMTFHTHPSGGSFSAKDVRSILSSPKHRVEAVLTDDYVYIMKRKGASPSIWAAVDADAWEAKALADMQEYVTKGKKQLIKSKGYTTDQDFRDLLHDFWIEYHKEVRTEGKILKEQLEYYRIPIEEFEGLYGYKALFYGFVRPIAQTEEEIELVDDIVLHELFMDFVDYVEVYE